jgi:sulfur-carrier protein adenylyltransferase/sulfurtransferase
MWYVLNAARFGAEREALATLEESATWLEIRGSRIDTPSSAFCVDADISAAGRVYPVTLRYGLNFPSTPPAVLARTDERWSEHQYTTGELCLEYGPDNWRPDLTGADMLRSAERLLREQAHAAGPLRSVPSRHLTTVGQDFRGRFVRPLVTEAARAFWDAAPTETTFTIKFWTVLREESFVILPKEVTTLSGELWNDHSVPQGLERAALVRHGLGLLLPSGIDAPEVNSRTDLFARLSTFGFAPPDGYTPDSIELIFVKDATGYSTFWAHQDSHVSRHRALLSNGGQRLSVAHAALSTKKVGVVGCGSAGGKIATMLARSGVLTFVLVDDDILLPENVLRNDLDWSHVGEHKADALAERISLVAPSATCDVRRQRLGGQESNASADWALTRLRGCDLIVDATASSHVFNLLAGIARGHRTLIWLEVFAGGIGGMIARARPRLDPDPFSVRARIAGWCEEKGIPAPASGPTPYEGILDDSLPLIADDADVTVIAAHAARMCIDALLSIDPSSFPASAYMIGLARHWIFDQPFHTWPIDVGKFEGVPEAQAPVDPAHVETILGLIHAAADASSNSS